MIWQISHNEVRQIAAYVRSLGRVESTPLPGDRDRGRDVFEGASGCGSCPIAFEIEGRQRIAVAAGKAILVFGL
jgi:hypothetical protein